MVLLGIASTERKYVECIRKILSSKFITKCARSRSSKWQVFEQTFLLNRSSHLRVRQQQCTRAIKTRHPITFHPSAHEWNAFDIPCTHDKNPPPGVSAGPFLAPVH
eukprot:1652609-Karenia_brevis.AAC.1